MIHLLYNPIASSGKCEERAREYFRRHPQEDVCFYTDITSIEHAYEFIMARPAEESIVIAGGDGTLNHLINDIAGREVTRQIRFLSCGTGNDFLRDLGHAGEEGLFELNPWIEHLPRLIVNGKTYRFLNGAGFGIDGYVCQELEKQKKAGKKKIDFAPIAFKALAYAYKPCTATVTVDGETQVLEKMWLAPTMKGRYFGGGFKIAPHQDRNAEDRHVTLLVAHGITRPATLILLLKAKKGGHLSDKKHVHELSGHRIRVRFDEPTPFQIDGEVLEGVKEYEVIAG